MAVVSVHSSRGASSADYHPSVTLPRVHTDAADTNQKTGNSVKRGKRHETDHTSGSPRLKKRRDKTSTWPSVQHKLWLDISSLPLHQLREDERLRTESRDSQIQSRLPSAGSPFKVLWSSTVSTADPPPGQLASTLPSRLGYNTLDSYLRQRGRVRHHTENNQLMGLKTLASHHTENQLLGLRTLARNPSRAGSCQVRARPSQNLTKAVQTNTVPPNSSRQDLSSVYRIKQYIAK